MELSYESNSKMLYLFKIVWYAVVGKKLCYLYLTLPASL
jgi:hypothetical protein